MAAPVAPFPISWFSLSNVLVFRRVPRASTSFGATGQRGEQLPVGMPANAAMLGFCLAFAHRPLDAASLPPPARHRPRRPASRPVFRSESMPWFPMSPHTLEARRSATRLGAPPCSSVGQTTSNGAAREAGSPASTSLRATGSATGSATPSALAGTMPFPFLGTTRRLQ